MPIYEYECGNCGEEHEIMQKISEGPLRKCPACGALKLRRKISRSAFHLKGSGWYVTDYGSNGRSQKENASSSGAKPDASTSGEGKEKTSESSSKSGGESTSPAA